MRGTDALGVSYFPSKKSKALKDEAGENIPKTLAMIVREIFSDPRAFAKLYALKMKMLFNDHEIPANYSFYVFRRVLPWSRIFFVSFIWVLPWAALGLFSRRSGSPPHRDFYFFLAASFISAATIHIQSRYRFPMVPFLLISAASGLEDFIQNVRQRAFAATAVKIAVAVALFVYAWPYPSYGVMTQVDAKGKRVLQTARIDRSDYMTWIASLMFLGNREAKTQKDRLLEEAERLYGKDFGKVLNEVMRPVLKDYLASRLAGARHPALEKH